MRIRVGVPVSGPAEEAVLADSRGGPGLLRPLWLTLGSPFPALGPSVKIGGSQIGPEDVGSPGAPQRGKLTAVSADPQPEAAGGRAAAPEAAGAGAAPEGGRPGPPAEPLCPAGGAAAPQPAAGPLEPAQGPAEGGPVRLPDARQPAVRPHLGHHSGHFRGEGAAGASGPHVVIERWKCD